MAVVGVVSEMSATRFCVWFGVVLFVAATFVQSQVTWTPIYLGEHSQVDLWTKTTSGCACSFNSSSNECACCVPSGGCSCGAASPDRCAQCGLEEHCANMCNITLDSKQLFRKSDRGFGQIKSPSLEGPSRCTYRFVPDTGQRVELQIYRLISIGRHNGTACEGGWLQLEGGARVCGRNKRFAQPVVLFSDKPVPILHMQINENTTRSQFLAYFSFSSKASVSVGWPVRGGHPVNNTECDWLYEDTECHDGCVLASPGHPGLYPPNSRCLYLITSSPRMSIAINFTGVLLPANHCTSDYIAVYSGPTTASPLLKMLCGKEKMYSTSLMYTGQKLLVEFRTGLEVPPFNYSGFIANLNFIEITTETPTTTTTTENVNKNLDTMKSIGNNVRYNNRDLHDQRKDQGFATNSCDLEVNGEEERTGHYDTRGKPKYPTCRLVLYGRAYDTGHVSLTSYNLRAQSCQSSIEIYDGHHEEGMLGTAKSLERICSPAQRLPGEFVQQDTYVEPKRYSSNGRNMTVVLRRAPNSPADEEYMDVSYYFHNEREGGTQQPTRVCDVEYYGLSSPVNGSVVHPEPHRLFAMKGPVKCRQYFIPEPNQSVIIRVESSSERRPNNPCETKCGDSGCHCVSNESLENMDHLLLVSETGHIVTCFCGNYQDWLPVGIRSWIPVYIEWSRFSEAGLNFRAAYEFINDTYCGYHETNKPEGEVVNGGDLASTGLKLNQYYHQRCTWILNSLTDRQLTIEVKSAQSRPCTAWNLTIHEHNKTGDPAGLRLYTFCSRDTHKTFTLPWKTNTVVLRLQALGRTAPAYTIKWRSQSVIANTHKSAPSPAPNHVLSSSTKSGPRTQILLLTTTFLIYVVGF
ncbi:cubilin isoform X1 [Lasioglossum baleicum]|uniref:cubilin isoform X1 n=2 Tax=Lasioglossum baleicum TaxID=434251 RepID=UPI003FCE05D4